MAAMTRVLITGATGFVGHALVPYLTARGHIVRIAVRNPDAAPAAAETVRIDDIGPDTAWQTALSGVDLVVHLAARVHVMRETASDPLATFRRVNVEGTRRLAVAAAAAGIRRFLFMSSIKALADEAADQIITDASPPQPSSPYGVSKLEAERALADIAGGMEWTVLRPPLVYGPGVGGNFRRLLALVDSGVPLPLGRLQNRRSMVAVGNLVSAVELCLRHPGAARRSFLIQDGPPLTTPDLVRKLAHALDVPCRLLPVPPGLLASAAAIVRQRPLFDRLAGSLVLDDSDLRTRLGWQPPYDIQESLNKAAAWFCSVPRKPVLQRRPAS